MRMIGYFIYLILAICPIFNAFAASNKLIFAVDIIRHGDRTPITETTPNLYLWPAGLGELTPKGIQQEYKLGKQLRDTYVTRYHLLPKYYLPGTLYVRSSDYNRTLMSAQAFLTGLYPPGTGPDQKTGHIALPYAIQPIPIHTIPKEQDSLLLAGEYGRDHTEYHFLLEHYVYNQSSWQKRAAEIQARYIRGPLKPCLDHPHLEHLIDAGDNLLVRKLHNIPPPVALPVQAINGIIADGQWVYAQMFASPVIGKLLGRELLTEISRYLQQASTHKTVLKYVLYSAHDSTILSVMSGLGAPLQVPPAYSSDLNFSLLRTPENNFIVKITLNGSPVHIPGSHKDSCTLAHFLNYVRHNTYLLNYKE